MRPGTQQAIRAIAWLACLSTLGCQNSPAPAPPPPSAAPSPPPLEPLAPPLEPLAPPRASAEGDSVIANREDRELLVERLPGCEIEHHGRLIDLGLEAASPWTGFRPS